MAHRSLIVVARWATKYGTKNAKKRMEIVEFPKKIEENQITSLYKRQFTP